ncbi:hypothetical protein BC827DRAFT_1168085 [Russula dissimulans]|nr:hypothetical protein BC827DRAFT_1168085 [Russula dissimulans]
MATNLASEQAFKAHIHRLLDEHVAVHLTTPYVHSTQLHVYEILTASLLPVSEEDPRSLVPPSDTLDDFIRGHCHIEPKAMCEGLPAVKESQERIYSTMKTTPLNRILTSQFPDTFCSYSPKSDLFGDPPVLTVRSIQHTPIAGGSKIPCFVPLKMTEVLSQISKEIAPENFDDAVNTQNEDAHHSQLVVDYHNLKEILLLYKANPFSTSPPESAPSHKSLYRMPSPPLLQSLHRTPPLFSRINVLPRLPASTLDSMFDFPSVVPTTRVSLNGDGDEGTPEYEVISTSDEWAISSSLTLSPNDGASEQDDLFAPSPEPLGPIDDLLAANMDTFHIPRQLRAGKSHGGVRVPGQGRLLYEYIGDVVDRTRDTNTITKLPPASDAATSPTLVHCVGAFPRSKNICPSSDDVEDGILGRLTRHFASEAIDSVLFDQPNDIKHCLLDVPQLPPPNVHTRTVLWPNNTSSLINHEDYAAFYVAKAVKSLTLELTWRPYNSEKAIPTREELLGVSDFNYFPANSYADGEEGMTQLAGLMEQLKPLTRPISAEDENQRELQAILKSPKTPGFNTDELSTLNCGISNVLLTRAERHKSWLPSRTHLGDYDNGTKWERGSCTTQPHSPERMIIDGLSKDECHVPSTDCVQLCQMDPGTLVYGDALLSYPSEDVAPDAEIGIVSASHVHMPEESVVSVSTADLYRDSASASVRIPRISDSSRRSWIPSSETGDLEANYVSAFFGLASCEEQSLHGYLHVLSKQALARTVNDVPFASSASSEVQRLSNPPVDTEVQYHELLKLAAPLPFLEVSPHHNHRYLASVELLQDRPLMRALHVDSLRIELLEREWLDGADIVFDCDTALVFVPMSQALLPSSFRSFKDRLSSLSWRYTHLVVVFQLYDCGVSGLQDEEERANSFARVIKSISKLHRELALAEAFGTKQPQTVVQMYSVRTNEEAATAARLLGDMAESRSQFGPWGDRLWLVMDEKEDERYLSAVDGMNAFAAAAILGYISLQDFLALRADQRLQLGLPIPEGMINRFNEVIAERNEHVDTVVGDDDGIP